MEGASRKLIRQAAAQIDIAKNEVEDEIVPDVDIIRLEWESLISYFAWCGNVVIGPNDGLYFEGSVNFPKISYATKLLDFIDTTISVFFFSFVELGFPLVV